MNLFILAQLVKEAAIGHCDKHCIKMILETCQLLYTAHHYNTPEPKWDAICPHEPYRMTHKNHPCAVWVRAKQAHYEWAVNLGFELCREYQRRFGKEHKCYSHLQRLARMGYPKPCHLKETYTAPPRKRATLNCPKGCDYFDCAINDKFFDTCAVYVGDKLDCVATYRNYYHVKEWELKWNKGKDKRPAWYTKTFVPKPKESKRKWSAEEIEAAKTLLTLAKVKKIRVK